MLRKRLHKHYTPSSYYNIIYYMYVVQTGGGSRIFPVGILRICRILLFCIWFHTVNIWLSIRCIQMSSLGLIQDEMFHKKYIIQWMGLAFNFGTFRMRIQYLRRWRRIRYSSTITDISRLWSLFFVQEVWFRMGLAYCQDSHC